MRHPRSLTILTTAIILLAASMVPTTGAQDAPPRTYYDSLNLDTPEDAAQTFVDAFQRLDFPTVFLVLAPDVQFRFQQYINLLRYDVLLDYPAVAVLREGFPRLDTWEHMDLCYHFDTLMLIAVDSDGLLIDLRGDVQWTGEQEALTLEDGEPALDLLATVEGINGPVRFRMVRSPQRRWRVLQVIVPGGDEEQIPWSVPPPVYRRATSLWRTPCDGTTPPQPEPAQDKPYLLLASSCGDMPGTAGGGDGTEITVQGFNFQPGVEVSVRMYNPDLDQNRPVTTDEPIIAGADGTFIAAFTPPRWRGLELPVTMEIQAGQVFHLKDN